MTYLYYFSLVSCNGILTYLIYRFNSIFLKETKFSGTLVIASYVLFLILKTSLPFTTIGYFTGWAFIFCLYIGITVVYKASILRKLMFGILLLSILIIPDYSLIVLSNQYHLSLYNPPFLSASAGNFLYVTMAFILILFLEFVKKLYHKEKQSFVHWLAAFCVPVTILYFLIFSFFADKKDLDFSFYVSSLAILTLIALIFYLYDRKLKMMELSLERNLIMQRNEHYQHELEILKSSEEQIKSIRHDLQNHLMALQSMFVDNQVAEASLYVSKIIEKLSSVTQISSTQNTVIDSLINYKLQDVQMNEISLNYEAAIPRSLDFDAFDLTIVLGNLLDNALEALQKESCETKSLHIQIGYSAGCLTIKIKNTYDGIIKESRNGFLTTKPDAKVHGIGLKNLRSVVERHHGILDLSHDDTYFTASVILPI